MADNDDLDDSYELDDEIHDEIQDQLDNLSDLTEDGLGWLYENEWAIGVIYLIVGPLVAIFGSRWFPYIVASLVALFTISVICGLSLSFGWMGSVGGSIATVVVALILGVLLGCLVRRHFKWMLGLLGLIAGFFGGSLIFALISGMSGWNAVWGFWVISVLMAIIGCILAIYLGLPLVMVATSLVGSYLFMRSWTLFFPGNYPSESQLIASKGEDSLDMGGIFWLYIGIFIVCFAVTLTVQCKYGKNHQELDDHFTKA